MTAPWVRLGVPSGSAPAPVVLAARALADAELDDRYKRLYRHDVVGGET